MLRFDLEVAIFKKFVFKMQPFASRMLSYTLTKIYTPSQYTPISLRVNLKRKGFFKIQKLNYEISYYKFKKL